MSLISTRFSDKSLEGLHFVPVSNISQAWTQQSTMKFLQNPEQIHKSEGEVTIKGFWLVILCNLMPLVESLKSKILWDVLSLLGFDLKIISQT